MASWTSRGTARHALTALAVVAGSLGAQSTKCDLPMQAHPTLLKAGLQFNGVFKATAKPEDKAKALQMVVKTLTDDIATYPANMQPSRNFLLGQTLGVCLFVVAAYGFTVVAMLVPAISEFDTALGRSVMPKG